MAKTKAKGKKKNQAIKKKPTNAPPRKLVRKTGGIKPSRIFIYALALAAFGGGGYLVYDRIRRKKRDEQNQLPSDDNSRAIIINNSLPASYNSNTSKSISSGSDAFPLKRGSKGSRVLMLQQALARTTPSISIDGKFGVQTSKALKAAGYSEVVDETIFNKILGVNNVQVVFNPGLIAVNLFKVAQNKSLEGVLSLLKQIKSATDYSSVNDYYKKQSFISKTIVTDLLEYAFSGNETAREHIRNEFLRMGLKVDGSGTWSLQGIRLYKDLITIRETVVTDGRNNRIPVRKDTILGDELEVANGMTWFQSIDSTILKVPTQDVTFV